MILNHSVSLLRTGKSSIGRVLLSDAEQITFALQTGIKTKRLDCLKTSLVMLEVIKVTENNADAVSKETRFSNFINYLFKTLSEPAAMAVIKYAIADRRIKMQHTSETAAMGLVNRVFKPVMINDSKDPQELKKYSRFLKLYNKLKENSSLSISLNTYLVDSMEEVNELFAA